MDDRERFLKNVKYHAMSVLLDTENYRHIKFRNPKHGFYAFSINTWPGHLAFSGDMGTFVFSRGMDLFRGVGGGLDYISEKVVAADSNGRETEGVIKFDHATALESAKRMVIENLKSKRDEIGKEKRRKIYDEIMGSLEAKCDCEHEWFTAVSDACDAAGLTTEYWETGYQDYMVFTGRFRWCVEALQWAVKKYDESKKVQHD